MSSGSGSDITAQPGSNYKKFNADRRRELPRNDTAIDTLDDLFEELQKEKVLQPKNMLKRTSRMLSALKVSVLHRHHHFVSLVAA